MSEGIQEPTYMETQPPKKAQMNRAFMRRGTGAIGGGRASSNPNLGGPIGSAASFQAARKKGRT